MKMLQSCRDKSCYKRKIDLPGFTLHCFGIACPQSCTTQQSKKDSDAPNFPRSSFSLKSQSIATFFVHVKKQNYKSRGSPALFT